MDYEALAVKTIPGTTNSVYVVAFEGDGLRVAVRPFVHHNALLLALALRVRVEAMSPDGSVLLAQKYFGMPFEVKGGHASTTMAVPIMSAPFGAKEANQIVFSKNLIGLLLDDLIAHVSKHKKMKQVSTTEALFEVLSNQTQDQLPSDPLFPVEHKVHYNDLSPVLEQIKAALSKKKHP